MGSRLKMSSCTLVYRPSTVNETTSDEKTTNQVRQLNDPSLGQKCELIRNASLS